MNDTTTRHLTLGRKQHRRAALAMIGAAPLGLGLGLGLVREALAQPGTRPDLNPRLGGAIEPGAGAWRTWLLESGHQLRLAPPPDTAATQAELDELRVLATGRDAASRERVAYWDAGSAPYRWNELAVELSVKHGLSVSRGARALTLVNAAVHDALVAAWDSKYHYQRPRPSELDPSLTTLVAISPSPSYPCEHAVAAGAASAVLGHLFPNDAQALVDMADEAARSRLLAGVQYPSDVDAGLALGRAVAGLAIDRARADNFGTPWSGTIPTEPGRWTGQAAVNAEEGLWRPWVLTSADEVRPGPPPAFDSPEMAAELAEVKDFARTPRTNGLALYWQFGFHGGPLYYAYWIQQTSQRLLEQRLDHNAPLAARAYLLVSAAMVDTWIATQDTKFHYWGIRPNQLDPSLTTVFATPSFPSYPSNRTALNYAVALVLGQLFRRDADRFLEVARQSAESAIWAGIHFRSDLTSAQAIAERVAGKVLAQAT